VVSKLTKCTESYLEWDKAWLLPVVSSIALGLFSLFVWSPLPYNWEGFDGYYNLGLSLARGEAYPTMHRIWGYPFFLAFFYRFFGERLWIPLVAQVLLNSLIPLMVYRMVRLLIDKKIAAISALLVGFVSFNTLYTATQSSDCLSNVLFVASIYFFIQGIYKSRTRDYALSGICASLAYQFRPNLILYPVFMIIFCLLFLKKKKITAKYLLVYFSVFILCSLPWVLRNYRVSGLFVPATTHGAIQLWYASLQVGQYSDNWFYNDKANLESPVFSQSVMADFPIKIRVADNIKNKPDSLQYSLVYWTDRDTAQKKIDTVRRYGREAEFMLPGQTIPTTLFYYLDYCRTDGGKEHKGTIAEPSGLPFIHFINDDHLGNLDRGQYLLDIFEVMALARHIFFKADIGSASDLDLDTDGSITEQDLRNAINYMLSRKKISTMDPDLEENINTIKAGDNDITVLFKDNSQLVISRSAGEKITGITPARGLATKLVYTKVPFPLIKKYLAAEKPAFDRSFVPGLSFTTSVDNDFYRSEPRMQARYLALAKENIRQRPWDYTKECLKRMYGLFLVQGSSDAFTAHQFRRSGIIYKIGFIFSLSIMVIMVLGIVIGFRRKMAVGLFLLPILYIVLTIAPLLKNMRYSMTVQPFMIIFISITIYSLFSRSKS
jgi:Dolichyl-phosphate-mannose-protein mannosyltransferase